LIHPSIIPPPLIIPSSSASKKFHQSLRQPAANQFTNPLLAARLQVKDQSQKQVQQGNLKNFPFFVFKFSLSSSIVYE